MVTDKWEPLFGDVSTRRAINGSYCSCWACGATTGRLNRLDAILWARGHADRCPQKGLFEVTGSNRAW